MNHRSSHRELSWLLPALLLSCCGYSTRSLLPSYLKTYALKPVENSTLQVGLSDAFSDALARAFAADRSLRVDAAEDANLLLSATVSGYSREASVYDQNQNIQAYELAMTVQVEATDQVRSEPFFSESVSQRVSYDPAAETEEDAAQRCLDKLAQEVVRRVITKW